MSEISASAPCSATLADDGYMGYADRDELLAALNLLLEAERAGTRVALDSLKSISDPALTALVQVIYHDESRWCAMLTAQIKRLDAVASRRCGDFYDKAIAIEPMIERLIFLNRGQAWVVRKLAELLPRVRDDALHTALDEMRFAHDMNIAAIACAVKQYVQPSLVG